MNTIRVKKNESYDGFEKECESFLENAFNSHQWFIWIAEVDDKIVSHIYIELVQKVPRPGRITYPFVYMTNVFTVAEYRNKGIGSKLLNSINEWVEERNYEFVMVWPSNEAINYYKKNGYEHSTEVMQYFTS